MNEIQRLKEDFENAVEVDKLIMYLDEQMFRITMMKGANNADQNVILGIYGETVSNIQRELFKIYERIKGKMLRELASETNLRAEAEEQA